MTATLIKPTAMPLSAAAGFRARLVLAVLLLGTFMASADIAIVNVAAPDIRSGLGTSAAMALLIVSGYTITYAMLLVAAARLGAAHGHARVFRIGVVGFTAASLACGAAPSAGLLLGARLVQGAMAALMAPQVVSIIQLRFADEARARALALYAAVISLGVVAGLVLGGALVSLDLLGSGWRPVFLVNVPVGIVLSALAGRVLPAAGGGVRRPLDVTGTLLIAATAVLLLVPAILGQQEGWPGWTFASFAAGGLLALATAVVLRRRAPGEGIVDVRIFRAPGVAVGFLSIFASTAAYGGFLFSVALLLQAAVRFDALEAGLSVAPYAAGFALSTIGFARLPAQAKRRAPALGLGLLALGYAALGALAEHGTWHVAATIAVLALAGAGYGCGFSPVIAATLARVPLANAADASGSLSMTLQLGYMAGVAVLGSVFVANAQLPDPARAGEAFALVAIALAALAGVAALLARRTTAAAAAVR